MTPTLRVRDPQELLALIPFQLGFQPRESVVVVSLRGPRRQVGLVMRVDLAALSRPGDGHQLARSMVSHVVADGGRDAVLVVYTDAPVPAGAPGPAGSAGTSAPWRAVGHVRDAAEAVLGPIDAWVVATTGYSALGCTDPRCCPPGGRPLSDLLSTVVGAEMVLAGAVVMETRDELGWIPPAPEPARRRARAAANRWRRRAQDHAPAPLTEWRQGGLATWRAALAGEASAAGLGRLEAALDDIAVRDAILLSLIPGAGDLPERFLEDSGGPGTDSAIGRAMAVIVDPQVGVPPEDDLASAAQRALEGVVAHGRGGRQAPALTLLALLSWWRGSAARAGVLLERAQSCDPRYRLAELLGQALEAGMAPGWVRRPDR